LTNDLRNLNQLLSSLLELAHINRDKAIPMGNIRLDELVFSAIQSIKNKYPGRRIMPRISYTENETDLIINGNSGLLEIAVKNLIDNACKFSTGDVEVIIEMGNKGIVLAIADQGVGIPKSEQETIFKPFSRGTNARYIGGFGIGLSIVLKIIELHSAEIQLKSTENEGTRVEIIFSK
jgi:signal transduction histidine kinase